MSFRKGCQEKNKKKYLTRKKNRIILFFMKTKLLTTKQLAMLLDVKPMTLYQWRHRGQGPTFLKFDHTVRYAVDDVKKWLKDRRREAKVIEE